MTVAAWMLPWLRVTVGGVTSWSVRSRLCLKKLGSMFLTVVMRPITDLTSTWKQLGLNISSALATCVWKARCWMN